MHSTEANADMNQAEGAPTELSIGDALSLAVQLHQKGQLLEAEVLYRKILEVDPDQPDALAFLGAIAMHGGEFEDAVALLRRSIALDAPNADRYNNLGNILLAAERIDEAVEAYRNAIEIDPGHANAYNNLGVIFRAQRRFGDAAQAYERALEIDPQHVPAYNNYGNLHSAQGNAAAAFKCFAKALTLQPLNPDTRKNMATAYAALGQLDRAADIYRSWLAAEPDNPGARHLLAACSGEGVPERASDAYIETTFDNFASRFDSQLASLEYRAPDLVANALRRALSDARRPLNALDAGCGTGLCGPLIQPYVDRLTGVDLSGGMLQKAQQRGVYAELVKGELGEYLASARAAFDVIVSADTLVYFGALDGVARAARGALRAGGVFIFTVEKAEEAEAPEGYRINPHGRYSQTRGYVERTLRRAGFADVSIEESVLRQEKGEPVAGLVVTARAAVQNGRGA